MADKEVGGQIGPTSLQSRTHKTLAKHMQKQRAGRFAPGGPRPRSNNAPTPKTSTKHNKPSRPPPKKHSLTHNDLISSVEALTARTFNSDRARRTTDRQIPLASPSHRGALSRAHAASLARTHATQSKSKSISRFGGRLLSPKLRYMCIYVYSKIYLSICICIRICIRICICIYI